jgi:Asp-tRNA(Asn)/Glu-tRNA(Gln) amidotransferase A subunit family amidase
VDVLECVRRIRETDAEIRAWVEVSPQPPTGDGPLNGVPFGVKDIFETRGLATEYGSPLYAGRKGTDDAALVAHLRSLGAILVGKTHTTAFASFDPAPTRNPRAAGRTPGGSSAGSAAAVAAGHVPFAIGTQTLGSVIRPAAFCGICGFKPTYGRLPFDGALPFAPSLDTVGFFTPTAREMQMLWAHVAQASRPVPAERSSASPFEPPEGWSELLAAAHIINRYEGARTHAGRYREFGDRMGARLADLIRRGLATSDAEYRAALAHVAAMRKTFESIFASARFLISPATPGPAPLGFDTTGDPVNNAPWTALGVPAITIPVPGADPPLGLQITAAWGNDDALVACAAGMSPAV